MNKLVLAATAISAVAASANAETNILSGFYAGVEYQRMQLDYQKYTVGGTTYSGDDIFTDGLDAVSPYVGYQFDKYFGLEASYIKSADGEDTILFTGNDTKLNIEGYTLDVVGNMPVTENFSLLGAAGVGHYKADVEVSGPGGGSGDEDDTGYRAGAGVQYNFNENVGIRSMLRYTKVDFDDTLDGFTTFSLGVNYKF